MNWKPPQGWIWPRTFLQPPPAPEGFTLEVEYDGFLGVEKRWRYLPA